MLTFDNATRANLNGATSLAQWATLFASALGNSGVIRAFRDANAAAANPFLTGTEFRNLSRTGALTIAAGKITKLGTIEGTTISAAADMASGKSVLRIEGNGHWVQGSLGLSSAAQIARGVSPANVVAYDFTVRGNFTATNGFSITPNFTLSGDRLLPSGTGPAAPALDANAPNKFEIWNWTNPASPVLVGSTVLGARDVDFVFEDAARAAEVGDTAVYQTTNGILFNQHEFGFTLLASHAGNTETNDKPLYQVIGAAAHRGTWTGYPQSTTFDPANHVLIPDAFKVVVKNSADVVLGTIEWSNGRAINAVKTVGWDSTKPIEPNWNIGMLLYWENTAPKMSVDVLKTYAGMEDAAKRPSRAKVQTTVNGVEPLITGGYQGNSQNGLHNIYAVTQWPNPRGFVQPVAPADPNGVVDSQYNRPGASSEFGPWSDGWDYQPGSYTTHNWYSGPGGPRFDRAAIPSTLALWVSDPNGVRPQSSVPWKSMGQAYCKAYFNHSNHHVSNPHTLQLATDNDDLFKNWTYGNTYYDGHYIPTVPKQIDIRGNMRDGDSDYHRDKNGQFFWSGWARDILHGYGHAGWASIVTNSPAHAIASKWDTFFEEVSSVKDDRDSGNGSYRNSYMVRVQAWRWLNYTLAWKNASSHRLGVTRTQIEAMFTQHLELIYSSIIKPVFIDNEQSDYAAGLRNLGTPIVNGGQTVGGGLGFYMTSVLVLMKQTGMWSQLMKRGGNVKTVLEYQIRNMDKYAFGMLVDTDAGEWGGGGYQYGLSPVPTSWATSSRGNNGVQTLQGLWTDAAGNATNDKDVSVHLIASHAYAMRDYFPELTHPDIAKTITRLDVEFNRVTAAVAAATSSLDKTLADHVYGYPGVSIVKAPTVLGPA